MRRNFLILGLAALAACLAGAASAAGYPDKSIRVVVPFAAGGGSDIFARIVGQKLAERLGQPVVIDNRPGAGGTLGADLVAKAPPDGYILLVSDVAIYTIAPSLYAKLPYVAGNLAPVINLATSAHILVAAPGSPLTSFTDMVARAKAESGRVTLASSGNGTSTHLTLELVNSLAHIKLTHVPYKGGGAAITDVMGGQVDAMFIGTPPAMPLLQSAKLKALAVTTIKRMGSLPAVPTVAESGLPGFESLVGQGMFAPAGTPQAVVVRLNTEIARIIREPEVIVRWSQLGADPVDNTPKEFAAWLQGESAKWSKVVREAGVKAD